MANRQASNRRKVRISLDLSATFYERLDALEVLTQAESKAGVIRQALQIYEYVVRRASEGYEFRTVSPAGKEENVLFFSPYVASPEELVLSE
jgi:hypothetical protein